MKTVFLRLLEAEDKERALLGLAHMNRGPGGRQRFDTDPVEFSVVPRSPFAYWVSERVRDLFLKLPPFEMEGRTAKHGAATLDDMRFLRLASEVTQHFPEWVPFAKGGNYSPHYADISMMLNWATDGREVKAYVEAKVGSASRTIQATDYYFRPALTWTAATTLEFSIRALPSGCVFGHRGPCVFTEDQTSLPCLLALLGSSIFRFIVSLSLGLADAGRRSYEVGIIQRTPVPGLLPADESALASLARDAWSLKRALDTRTEYSHAFSLPALLQSPSTTLAARATAWADRVRSTDTELTAIQAEIDDRCFALYDINDEDRKAITEGFGGTAAAPPTDAAEADAESASAPVSSSASDPTTSARRAADDADFSDESDESTLAIADATALTADLLSWSIGVAFGRFDLRLATGERALPPEPDPFDPLPVCSPGMLTGADGLPCATPPSGYPIDIPQDGVLLDDPGHPRDLTASARAVFDFVFGADADARWQEAAGILDPKNHDLRAFVARAFFEQHLKRYSKSRRKAPIYWQLATPSASYSVWLYAHRLTPETFFHVLHDVVAPKLGLEERKLLSLTQESGPNPTASQRKEIAGQEAFVDELRAFRGEVTRVAPLWKPDLDDGVLLTMAPLWRLVPQHRAWQKELKAAWDSLCAGEYDWAHAAMHLWPERVVPKCSTDRSLAIAHGLEDVFWEEDAKGKWAARKTPLTPVAPLVAERTSPAVRAALKDLLEAPQNRGASKGRRKGKADA